MTRKKREYSEITYEKESASKFVPKSKTKTSSVKILSIKKKNIEVKTKKVLELKISVNHAKFSIWRKILVAEDIKFTKLARILTTSMGWTGYLKWEFSIKGDTLYVDENNKLSAKQFKRLAHEMTIDYYKLQKNESFRFLYDIEKEVSWVHEVSVEEVHVITSETSANSDKHKALSYAICGSGANHCPPDDVGSPQNYATGLEILMSKQPKEAYNKWVDYLGEDYNSEEFDPKGINNSLKLHSYDEQGLKRDAEDEDLFAW